MKRSLLIGCRKNINEINFKGLTYDTSDEEQFSEDEEAYEVEELDIAADDEEAMRMFMKGRAAPTQQTVTLADIILEKIREKEMQQEMEVCVLSSVCLLRLLKGMEAMERLAAKFDPKVIQVYRG